MIKNILVKAQINCEESICSEECSHMRRIRDGLIVDIMCELYNKKLGVWEKTAQNKFNRCAECMEGSDLDNIVRNVMEAYYNAFMGFVK